jgi:hypothetical protein
MLKTTTFWFTALVTIKLALAAPAVNATDEVTTTQAVSKQSMILKPFKADYTFYYHGDALGTGTRQLEYLANGDVRYHYNSSGKWLIFTDERDETSIFRIKNNQIIPKYYRYQRTGTGKDKLYVWRYDIEKQQAINETKNLKKNIAFPEKVQDSLSYHLQQRINLKLAPEQTSFRYSVLSTSGKISEKVYEFDGEETLNLPYGEVTTLRFKREVKSKNRITYAWFAPALDYLLVKLNQYEKNKQEFEIQLNQVVFNPPTTP